MLIVQFLAIGSYAVEQQHRELHNDSHNIYAIEKISFSIKLVSQPQETPPALTQSHLLPHRYSDSFSVHSVVDCPREIEFPFLFSLLCTLTDALKKHSLRATCLTCGKIKTHLWYF